MKKGVFLLGLLSFTAIFSVIACKGNSVGEITKSFEVVTLKLWQEDIKEVDSVIVSEKASSKVLEIQVSNCENYKVTVSFAGKTYTGSSSLGIAEIPIKDITTEEKPMVIKLSSAGMNNFTKSLKVKKDAEDVKLKEFNVRKLNLWSRDIKDVSSIVVNAKDEPKMLEIEVENCNSYNVVVSLDGRTYAGSTSVGIAELEIQDLPTEEKPFVIKLTASDMEDFTKTITVKKDEENTQLKGFDVTKIRLWGHDIKDASSIIVNAKDTPKVLEIQVSNCDDYVVSVKLGEKSYTGNASSGKAIVEIQDLPTEEKSFVIKLTGTSMKDFTKTITVKKDEENTQPKEFGVAKIKLWGRDIKDVPSIVVNAKDTPKVLEIEVTNCDDYNVMMVIGGTTYTGTGALGIAEVEVNDISEEEKPVVIKLSSVGMKDYRKSLRIKKDAENTQLNGFDVTKIKLWGHDIKEENSVVVNAKDTPKTLEVEVSNCDDYVVSVKLGEKSYTGNASSGKAIVEIQDLPTEEKSFVIKLTGTSMKDFRKSLRVKKDEENTQLKGFDVTKIKLWGHDIKEENSVVVNAKDTPKTLEVEVLNCDDYVVSVKLGEKNYTENASSGKARIGIQDIPTEEKPFVIKLTGIGMKDFTKTITVKKDEENTQPKEFGVIKLKLWGHDIKDETLLIVKEKDNPKTLEVGVSNCDDYNVTMVVGGRTYTGTSTSGLAEIAIDDITEEEKPVAIKLSGVGMKDFRKSLKIKKEIEVLPPKEFEVTRMRLWGHNIKEENSVVVNAKDAPKTLEIEVSNCDDYVVSVKLGEENYTGNASSGKANIEIADIPTEEKPFVIKLTGIGMKDFTKSLKVKKTNENIQLEEFDVTKIRLWGHDIKTETSLIVNGKDIPKTLEIEVANCADYKVDAMLGEQAYTGDSVSRKVSIEIADIPKEEVVFSIKLSASGRKDWTKKLKVKKVDIDFRLHELNLWGHDIRNEEELKVLITDEPKILEVMVSNCDEYLVSVSLNGEEYKGNASSGNVELPIKAIPLEEKELTIKLSALGMNDFVKSIKVQRVKSNFEISALKLWGHDIRNEEELKETLINR